MDDIQYNLDGSIDLKWFNSLPKDNQIMFGGKWTAEQFADYNSKKTQLTHDEILNPEVEEYIEDCIETARIENKKFGIDEYFLGRKGKGEFILVGPYYDNYYRRGRHEYIVIEKTSMYIDSTYSFYYDEYKYKHISEEEFQTLSKKFYNTNNRMFDLLMNDSKILDRKVREGDFLWCYGGVMKIKAISYEMGKYWSIGYHCEGGFFAINNPIDSITYVDGKVSLFEQNEDWPHRLITEGAFLKGYEIAENTFKEIRDLLEQLSRNLFP